MTNPLYALILAGGSGERFWPLSRRARPKQLLKLVSDKTLLEETIERLDGLVPDERILVLTNVDQEAAVRELLPDLPPENIRRRAGEARHGCGRGPRHSLGRCARSSRDDDGAAGGSCDQGSGGIPKDDADGGPRRGGDRRAGHDWDQADLGLPGIWLHRTRRRPRP